MSEQEPEASCDIFDHHTCRGEQWFESKSFFWSEDFKTSAVTSYMECGRQFDGFAVNVRYAACGAADCEFGCFECVDYSAFCNRSGHQFYSYECLCQGIARVDDRNVQ